MLAMRMGTGVVPLPGLGALIKPVASEVVAVWCMLVEGLVGSGILIESAEKGLRHAYWRGTPGV